MISRNYLLTLRLLEIKPEICRRFVVPADITRANLIAILVLWYSGVCLGAVKIVPDNLSGVQGVPFSGFVEIENDSNKQIILEYGVALVDGGTSFKVTTPSGNVIEISQATYGTQYSGLKDHVSINVGDSVFFPVFLVFFDGQLIFEEVGEYKIEVEIYVGPSQLPLSAEAGYYISETTGDVELWKKVFPGCVDMVLPWHFAFYTYEYVSEMAENAGGEYATYIDQVFMYGAGSPYTPSFLECARRGSECPAVFWDYIQTGLEVSMKSSKKTDSAERMWEYIRNVYESYEKGTRAPIIKDVWIFR